MERVHKRLNGEAIALPTRRGMGLYTATAKIMRHQPGDVVGSHMVTDAH